MTHHQRCTPGEEAALQANPERSKFLPWTTADPAIRDAWMTHDCAGCGETPGPWCPTYMALHAAWKTEVERAARTPRNVTDRQLCRLGVDPAAFHAWRRERGLRRMAELTLPETERVMWWLLRRGGRF